MLRAGRTPELAESLGVSEQTLRNWRRQDQRDRHERDGGSGDRDQVSVYRLISAERASTPVSYVLPAARGEPLVLLRLGLSERNYSSELETVLRNMHSELRLRASGGAGDLQARDAAAELGEHGLGLEAELLEQPESRSGST